MMSSHRNIYVSSLVRSVLIVLVAMGLQVRFAQAEELKAGFTISKDNLDKIRNDTFEGKTIGSMIPDKLEWMIKNKGLTMLIVHSKKIEMDPKYVEATKKWSKNVKFNPTDRTVSGWTAGELFPPDTIKMDDPHAGDKVIWNLRADTYGSTMDLRHLSFVFISGKKGVDQVQRWQSMRYYMEGRLDGGPVVEGDGTIEQKTYLFATSPEDIRGLGTFSIRYNKADSSRPDDTWAYLKTVRRMRRLSGGAWMDPIGGTDQLYDDWDIWDAFPTKYRSCKLVAIRWIFAIAHSPEVSVDLSKKGTLGEFPSVDLKDAPYYFPAKNIGWEPRKVYVVEGTPPPEHPYSKKVVYIDVDFPRPYLGEAYDHRGNFWKYMIFQNRPDIGDDGYHAVMPVVGHVIDIQRDHATVWSANMKSDPKGVKASDVSLDKLKEIASGGG